MISTESACDKELTIINNVWHIESIQLMVASANSMYSSEKD